MANKVEVSPSGRASCRGCKKTIGKGELRFGEEAANPYSEDGGTSYRYWHLPCAATKVANALAAALATYDGDVPDRAALDAAIAEHFKPPTPYVERAPNGRARCRACDETTAKGELRAAFERTFEGPMGPQVGQAYVHVKCLPRYLEKEAEQGREVPTREALRAELEAHSKVADEDLQAVRDVLGTVAP